MISISFFIQYYKFTFTFTFGMGKNLNIIQFFHGKYL